MKNEEWRILVAITLNSSFFIHRSSLFKDFYPFFQWLKFFFSRLIDRYSKWHFCYQVPMCGQIPCTAHFIINQRVIMLQWGTEAYIFNHHANSQLMHRWSLQWPSREIFLIRRESFLKSLHYRLIFKEQHSAISTGKGIVYLFFCFCKSSFGYNLPQRLVWETLIVSSEIWNWENTWPYMALYAFL